MLRKGASWSALIDALRAKELDYAEWSGLVEEEIGRCVTPYTLPPDSPNLRIVFDQRDKLVQHIRHRRMARGVNPGC